MKLEKISDIIYYLILLVWNSRCNTNEITVFTLAYVNMSHRHVWIPLFLRHLEVAMENMQSATNMIPDEYHVSSPASPAAAHPTVSGSVDPESSSLGPQSERPALEFLESWSDKSHDEERVEPSFVPPSTCEVEPTTGGTNPVLGPEPIAGVPSHVVEEVESSPPVEPAAVPPSVPEWILEEV